MKSISILAPAKVNIHLDILNKRKDGYHNILSLFQMISLHDKLRFSLINKNGKIELSGTPDISLENNIIYKAISLFREHTGLSAGISVNADKQIPLEAGLGGGSSNAAATLRVLNHIFGYPLPKKKLLEIALELGSDVCFFLISPAATVSGRGEKIKPITPRQDLLFAIIMPDFRVSTQKAYSWFENEQHISNFNRITEEKLRYHYKSASPAGWPFFNSFLPVIRKKYPVLNSYLKRIHEFAPQFIGLSGSGSALFAVFNKNNLNKITIKRIKQQYPHVLFAEALDKTPDIKVINNT